MTQITQILLTILVLVLAFPAGYLLAYLCKDELIDGRKWFKLLALLSTLLVIVFLFFNLIVMLIETNRIVLFVEILEFILWEFQDYTKKIYFDITASDTLNDSEIYTIKRFLMKLSNSDIIYKYSIDKKLIAGLRALSSNFLWQYSVSAKLQKVKRALLEESL